MTATSSPTLPEPVQTSLGFRARFLPTGDPAVLVGESWVAPGGGGGPLHRHLHQSERFEVQQGAITVRLGRTSHVVGTGQAFTIPAGAPHTFVNHTDEEAHVLASFTPPLRLEAYFTALFELGGKPKLQDLARLMDEFPEEHFYLAYVPVGVQRALGALVRRFG